MWKWCTLSKLTAEALSLDKALKEAFIRDFTQKSGSVAHRYERGGIPGLHRIRTRNGPTDHGRHSFSDLALDHAESLTAMLHCKADFAWSPFQTSISPGIPSPL